MAETYNDRFIKAMQHGVEALLHEWELPASSGVSLLNISENATFVARDPAGERSIIARVHRPGYHTRQEIESELSWIDSLCKAGIVSTAAPLPLNSGGRIAEFSYNGESRLVVGFEFLPGSEPAPQNDLKSDFYALGAITARLHDHSQRWRVPAGFVRKTWDFDSMLGNRPLWGDWREALGLDDQGRRLLEETARHLEKELSAYGKEGHRFGLVHADLRLANLLVDGKTLSVIDFDDCGFSWFMYDFAAAISFIEEDPQIPELQDSWVAGYRSIKKLSTADEAAIPTFIMLRRLLLTAWIASHAETETAQALGPAYTRGTIRLATRYLDTHHHC
ncbi:phosphotransferase enzyme family protein [Desulfosarcina ovata]|uniref:Aminoglycoside phosphotransferase n=1 Tax=Desulfosarcina ovata subsp. ovata TaxID=2752305 RepID=A0A5K8AB51_9BACT|nr:phosphotransferase [Desulfosarcina ovata]BBO89718.1 aminoglycoside phosphotransferase [Desulfosarcina ovata subsp. ovata]